MPHKWVNTTPFGSGHTLGTLNHGLESLFSAPFISIHTTPCHILFGFKTSTEYEFEYYLGLESHANTNTNIFSFEKSSKYKYE